MGKVNQKVNQNAKLTILDRQPSMKLASSYGIPLWKHSELFFEKKQFIPAVQQLLASYGR